MIKTLATGGDKRQEIIHRLMLMVGHATALMHNAASTESMTAFVTGYQEDVVIYLLGGIRI